MVVMSGVPFSKEIVGAACRGWEGDKRPLERAQGSFRRSAIDALLLWQFGHVSLDAKRAAEAALQE